MKSSFSQLLTNALCLMAIATPALGQNFVRSHKHDPRPTTRMLDQLGPYSWASILTVPSEEIRITLTSNQFDGFIKGKAGFHPAMDDAVGKTDPGSLRLNNAAKLILELQKIKDRRSKLSVIFDWVTSAITYDSSRPEPATDTDLSEWVQTPQKTVETGLGQCGDMGALIAVLSELGGIPKDDIYIVGIRGHNMESSEIGAHAAALVRIDNQLWIADRAEKVMRLADKYFSEPVDHFMMAPAYIVNMDGICLQTYGLESPGIFKFADAPPLRIAAGDASAYRAAELLGLDTVGIPKVRDMSPAGRGPSQ